MIKHRIKLLSNPRHIILNLLERKLFRIIPDKKYYEIKYKLMMGKKLNFNNVQTFNEKIQWLKLNDQKPDYTTMVDKYCVRKYISDIIGEEYLIPILGIYDSFDEIDINLLPNQFVLKPNHTSGNIYVCKDKSKLEYDKLRKEVKNWIKREYYWVHREWPYKNIKPKIICEKYMVDDSGMELKDYKIMCFNGEAKCSFVCSNRHSSEGLNVDFYDINWKPMPVERHYPNSGNTIPKPVNYDKMIEIAEILSKDIVFLRVDFYEIFGKLYIGELTFYPGSGYEEFTPESYDYLLGSWIKLP